MEELVLPFSVEPNANNHFAWVRTVMGLQRTHMAAVRTAVALIGFGFTVAEFFVHIRLGPAAAVRLGLHGPRNMGLVLIGAGVLSLAAFTVQYHRVIAYLSSAPLQPISGLGHKAAIRSLYRAMTRPVYLVSFTVLLIGVAAFVSILLGL
jgi:putative membrane protein